VTQAAEALPLVTAPRERGWRRLVFGLVAAAAVSAASTWPPSLALARVVVGWALPVSNVAVLVLAGVTGCAVAAWSRGGRWGPVVLFAGALLLWLRASAVPDPIDRFAVGWSLLIAATFGWWGLGPRDRSFLPRGLASVAVAGVVAIGVLGVRGAGSTDGVARLGVAYEQQFVRHRDAGVAAWRERLGGAAWQAISERAPAVRRLAERAGEGMATMSPPTPILPALIVLETLAALALAWATWHRFARTRLGPPLSALSDFRFHDQLVWGVVVGATLSLLPTLSSWRDVGVNVMVVFGALHALRGLGVLVWWIPERWAVVPLLLLLVSIPLLGPVLVLATVAVLALGLGLGDTWRDFRRTTRSLRPNARP
jgi:hypothetical protein